MTTHKGWMEKRRFERVDASVKVTYRLFPKSQLDKMLSKSSYRDTTADDLPELSKKSNVVYAVTRDISLGGMSLLAQEVFREDMALEIQLYLPAYPVPLNLIAEVVSAQEDVSSRSNVQFRAGIRILAINNEDVTRLDKFLLAEKLRKQNGDK